MKSINPTNIVFTPGVAGVGTLNLSAITDFDQRRLLMVTNQTKDVVIYATGTSKGATDITGSVVTLKVDTSTHSSGDKLQISYDSATNDINVVNFGGLSASTTSINGKNRLDVSLAGGHANGGVINGYGNLVGGSDGTNFRPIKLDTDGTTNSNINKVNGLSASTTSINGKNRLDVTLAGGHSNGALINGYGDLVGGTDGTNFRPIRTNTDGSVQVYNGDTLLLDTFTTFDTVSTWTVTTQASGDIIAIEGNALGCSYLVISLDPFNNNTNTIIDSKTRFKVPTRASFGLSRSQAVLGKEFYVGMVDDGTYTPPPSVAIAQISQTANTTLTVSTLSAHGLSVGMTFSITGNLSSVLNYPSLVVSSIISPTQFTSTGGPANTTLPATLTVANINLGGTVVYRNRLGGAANGTVIRFENASATEGSFYVRTDASDALPCSPSNILSKHPLTISTTAPTQLTTNLAYTYTFQATSQYDVIALPEYVEWFDKTVDAQSIPTIRTKKDQIVPNPNKSYKLRFGAQNNAGCTVINGTILSAIKTNAVTTASISTLAPHGLTSTDLVNIYGLNNQTQFANVTTAVPVLSVQDANTFAVAIGTAAVGSSYGGYFARTNGANQASVIGALTPAITSVSRSSNALTVNAQATFAALIQVGDYVNVVGCLSTDGTFSYDIGVNGAYRVQQFATNIAVFEPINFTVSPTGSDFGLTVVGGAVVKRTDLRVHYAKVYDFNRTVTESYGGFSRNDAAASSPVYITGGVGVGVTTSNAGVNVGQIGGQTTITGGVNGTLAVGGNIAVGSAPTINPLQFGGADQGGLTRRNITDVAGGLTGPQETFGVFTLSGAYNPTDGTHSKIFQAPLNREAEMYIGFTAVQTTPVLQVEGTFDGVAFTVIPLSRIDNTAASTTFTFASGFTPAANAVYKGFTHGYPNIRVHGLGGTANTNVGTIRIVPAPEVAGQSIYPFVLSGLNTTESVGGAAGIIPQAGVRTVAIPVKGSNKATLVIDAVDGTLTYALEGSSDNAVTYNALPLTPNAGGATVSSVNATGTAALPQFGLYETDVSNMTHVRVRNTAYTSGRLFGALKITNLPNNAGIGNSTKASYAASVNNLTPTASQNVLTVESGASKVTRIRRLIVSPGTATANGFATLTFTRTSVAATSAWTTAVSGAQLSRDLSDPIYSGLVKTGVVLPAATTVLSTSQMSLTIPTPINTTTSLAKPIVFDLTNNGTEKGFTIPVGITNGVMLTHSGLAGAAGFGVMVDLTEE